MNMFGVRMDAYLKSSALILFVILQWKGSYSQCGSGAATINLVPFQSNSIKFPKNGGTYDTNLMCQWLFNGGDDMKIMYRVTNADIDCGDGLTLRDGESSTSQALKKNLCTNSDGATFIAMTTSQQYLFAYFHTDASTLDDRETGFTIQVISGTDLSHESQACNGEVLQLTATSDIQYLTSPKFPGKRTPSVSCDYRIMAADTGATVTVDILFMDLDYYKRCYDTLTIIEASSSYKRKVCGLKDFNPDVAYTSTGNTIDLEYRNWQTNNIYGFVLSYKQNVPTTTTTTTTTTGTTSCATAGNFWTWLRCILRKIGEKIRTALTD